MTPACHAKRESLADYLANRDYVSSSQLRRFARFGLPASTTEPGAFDGSPMGEALHALVLEPQVFEARYLVLDGSGPSKKGISETDAMGREWLDAWQWSALVKARDAILSCARAPIAEWLSRGEKELSIYWSDEAGRRWKARPDCFTTEVVVDLKSTVDCRPEPFARVRERLRYDLQAAHYVDAVRRLTGRHPRFAYLAVELATPYAVWVHELTEAQVQRASAQLEELKSALFRGSPAPGTIIGARS
jgi:hypothetical protein